MLVLKRRIGEHLAIGDSIKVYVLGLKGNQVEVGIEAPRDIRVLRGEVKPYEEKEEEA